MTYGQRVCGIVLVGAIASLSAAQGINCKPTVPIFVDDFNDNTADGWSLVRRGDWSLDDGVLRESTTNDWTQGVVDDLQVSGQLLKTRVSTHGGYAGVVFWRQNAENFVSVSVYPASSGLRVLEVSGGIGVTTNYAQRTWPSTWYELGVCADSETGEIAIHMDGRHVVTHQARFRRRSGSSGVFTGNNPSSFDEFRLSAIPEIPSLNTNLLIDPGFEYVDKNRTLLSWENDDGKDGVAFAYSLGHTGEARPEGGGGQLYYSGGPIATEGVTSASQTIDLSTGDTALPSALGDAKFQLSGFFTSRGEKTDATAVRAVFSNFFGELGTFEIGGAGFVEGLSATGGQRSWGRDAIVGHIPPGSDRVQMQLVPSDTSEAFDGFVDDLDFRVFVPPATPGDFDGDGQLGLGDVDLLGGHIATLNNDLTFDLTEDALVSGADLEAMLDLRGTINGDADFDGEVGFNDFIVLATNFGLTGDDATWSKGDFITDQKINFTDFQVLSSNFGKNKTAVAPVPEPSSLSSLLVGMLGLLAVLRREVKKETLYFRLKSTMSPGRSLSFIKNQKNHSSCRFGKCLTNTSSQRNRWNGHIFEVSQKRKTESISKISPSRSRQAKWCNPTSCASSGARALWHRGDRLCEGTIQILASEFL